VSIADLMTSILCPAVVLPLNFCSVYKPEISKSGATRKVLNTRLEVSSNQALTAVPMKALWVFQHISRPC